MANHIYTCPVCDNLMTLTIDLESCPFQRSLVGQCEACDNKVEMLEDIYKEWVKGKEAKSDGQ